MDIRREVGLNLRRLRRERDLSQESLAFEAEIARTYMSGIERGVENPTVQILDRIARALNVTVADIVAPVAPLPKRLPRGPNVHRSTRKTRKPPKR